MARCRKPPPSLARRANPGKESVRAFIDSGASKNSASVKARCHASSRYRAARLTAGAIRLTEQANCPSSYQEGLVCSSPYRGNGPARRVEQHKA
jgi:hypothetical protein